MHGLVDLNFGTPDAPVFTRDRQRSRSKATSSRKARKRSRAATSCWAAAAATGSGGAGGADIIDGDAFLHVDLTRDANGNIFAGSQIIREIRYADRTAADANARVDTAI